MHVDEHDLHDRHRWVWQDDAPLALLARLRQKGVICEYLWMRRPYLFSFPFMVFCRLLGLTVVYHRTTTDGRPVSSEHMYYKNRAVSTVWPWLQLVDLIVMISVRVYPILWRRRIVICDRFSHDLLVDVMSDLNRNDLHKTLVGKLILRLTPKSARVLVFDVKNLETALQRKNDVPSLRYLSRRRSLYRLIAHDLGFPIVTTEQSIDRVQAIICRTLAIDKLNSSFP